MLVKPNSAYLTQCGYVVQLDHNQRGHVPILTIKGIPSARMGGFYWHPDGTIEGFDKEWTGKLRLVEQIEFNLPTKEQLPLGYDFADGMPFRIPKGDETFLSMAFTGNMNYYGACSAGFDSQLMGGRRFILRGSANPSTNMKVTIGDNPPFEAKVTPPYPFFSYDPTSIQSKTKKTSSKDVTTGLIYILLLLLRENLCLNLWCGQLLSSQDHW